MPSCGVCVCVCLCVSVTFVSCVKTNKDIFEIFSPSGNHTILLFLRQILWQYFDGDLTFRRGPPNGASNAGGVGKNRDYRRISGYGIDDCCIANDKCDGAPCSLPHRPPRISKSCLSQPTWMTTTRKREQNRFELYRYTAVNLKRNLRSSLDV